MPAIETRVELIDRVGDFVSAYLREPMLWPVFIAIAGHFVVVLAPLMSRANAGSGASIAALGVLALLTGHMCWRFGRRGYRALPIMLVMIWVVSVPVAWLAIRYNVF